MPVPQKFRSLFGTPALTRGRTILALALAVVADGLQLLLGPFGWVGVDQAIDVVAMLGISRCLGFHLLLLPTFLLELVPLMDELPTWTACTLAVILLRQREHRTQSRPTPPTEKPVIEI